MSETLAAAALRLCTLTCRNFGWRPRDFWSATPAEIATILADPETATGPRMDRQVLNSLLERESDGR